jgi:hypothetical protein
VDHPAAALLKGMPHERRVAVHEGVSGQVASTEEPCVGAGSSVRRDGMHHETIDLQPIEVLLEPRTPALLHRPGAEEARGGGLASRKSAARPILPSE